MENPTHDATNAAILRAAGPRPVPSSGVCLLASNPAHTAPKTASVPMLTSCARISMSTNAASVPVVTIVNAVAFAGVPNFGCTRANHRGRSPSRAITMYTRGCPMSDDNNAVVMAATAPNEMTDSAHAAPSDRNATAKGASTSMFAAGTIPVMTRLISAYNDAHTPRDPMIPIGRSRPGSRVSSAHVATVSNPTKEKKTTEAPERMPGRPRGANGVQLSASTYKPPATMTKPMTARETAVTTALNLAVSLAPRMRSAEMKTTSAAAGRSRRRRPSARSRRRASGGAWKRVAT